MCERIGISTLSESASKPSLRNMVYRQPLNPPERLAAQDYNVLHRAHFHLHPHHVALTLPPREQGVTGWAARVSHNTLTLILV